MSETKNIGLSRDELALYDRQIRLWGVSAQRRMGSARVFVYSMSGVNCEIIKNIVLAGIGSLTLCDPEDVAMSHLAASFLYGEMDVSKNRALSALPHVRDLNPRVHVRADTRTYAAINEEDIEQHDVIIVGDRCPLPHLIRLNDIARKKGKVFLCGGVRGFFGFFFSDVNHFEYTIKLAPTDTAPSSPSPTSSPSPSSSSSSDPSANVANVVHHTMEGFPLVTITSFLQNPKKRGRDSDSSAEIPLAKLRRVDPLLWAYGILLSVLGEGDVPMANWEDVEKRARDQFNVFHSLNPPLLSPSLMQKVFHQWNSELSPCCAIMGGIVGQEVLKLLGHEEEPLSNTFLFNGTIPSCTVEHIPLA